MKEWTWRDSGRYGLMLSMINVFGGLLRYQRKPFVPEVIMADAVKQTGLDDFGDQSYREGLEVLCHSYTKEADFNAVGRLAAYDRIRHMLINRLKIVDWIKKHPSIKCERITKPWIVIGLPRSGTTLTSQLFELDAHVRSPLWWEVENPIPPAMLATRYSDVRIAEAHKVLAQQYQLSPALPAIHNMEPLDPHECIMLMMYDFRSLAFHALATAPSYGHWYLNCDLSSAFSLHKNVLQIWQSEIATRTWALKTPNHLQHIYYLMDAYPDARIVWLHRDPISCIPSITSLLLAIQRPLTKHQSPDPVACANLLNTLYRTGIERTMDFDERSEEKNWCYHMHYSNLLSDPVAEMRAAYTHFGEEIEPEHESRILAWLRQKPKNAYGRHKYSLNDFGLSEKQLREQYADYTERYEVVRENAPN